MARGAIACLSTKNLLHNYRTLQKLAPKSLIMPMIKANAYGHGIRSVAKRLSSEDGLFSFGVASIEEALALRAVGIINNITLMEGVFTPDELQIASKNNFDIVIHNQAQLTWLNNLDQLPSKLNVWLKIDTGMGRLGFPCSMAQEAYRTLTNIAHIQKVIGVMTHFACADKIDHECNAKQIANFNQYLKHIPGFKSLCNSAATFNFQDYHCDVIRPGISLYGISPISGSSAQDLNLKPVMSLWSQIISIKNIEASQTIGYNADYVATKDMKIAIIAMGYGDGYPRSARNDTPVIINGKRCAIVGRVSMDMIAVDLSNCLDAQIGDKVELWGHSLPVEEVATYTSNISYDMITNIQYRVKFEWQDD